MTQPTYYQLPNEAGLAFRQHLNENLSGQETDFAGAIAPTSTQPFMRWLDTSVSPPVLRRRSIDNLSWELFYTTDEMVGIGGGGATQADKNAEFVSILDYSNLVVLTSGYTDWLPAFQAALSTGRPVKVPSGVYKISAPLTSEGGDFILIGDTVSAMAEKNNWEKDFSGTVISYYGPDSLSVISPSNSVDTTQIALVNIAIVAPKTLTASIVNIPGMSYSSEYSGAVTFHNVRIQTRDFDGVSNGINGYTSTGISIDCSSAKWGFGWSFTNVYIFGVQTGIKVNSSTSGFFNSNTFVNVKMYQVYRALYLYSAAGGDQIYANLFNGLYVQPNTQAGSYADGVVLLDGDVRQNTFISANVYDTSGVVCFKTINNSVRWGKDNVFITPESNDLNSINNELPGWGVDSRGNILAQRLRILAPDPSVDSTMTLQKYEDQTLARIRYPRNGASNNIVWELDGADIVGLNGATKQQSTRLADGGGGGGLYTAYGCRAFANFNGSDGVIRAGGNVSGVVRDGVGRYTITLSTAMPDKNYTVNVSAGYHAGVTDSSYCNIDQFGNWTPYSFKVVCKDDGGTYYDPDVVCVTIFR